MAIYHLSVKKISRSTGRSAIACAAYRSATKMYDEETRRTHDYTRKGGVKFSEIVLPKNAPAEYADREILWNAVQDAETQVNARLAREFELALPNELPFELQTRCLMEFAQNRADEGMVIDVNYHKRHKKKTDDEEEKKNDHGHLMATTRGFDENGKWAKKVKKEFALDENGNRIPIIDPKTGLQKVDGRNRKQWKRITVESNNWDQRENVERWRAEWAEIVNQALLEHGSAERVDHRSYKRQGIDKLPSKHEGFAARQIEARGGVSEICEYNRQVLEANGTCITYDLQNAALEAEKQQIKAEIEAEKARIEAEQQAKQVLTVEQKQQIKVYYRGTNDFWPSYRRAMERVSKDIKDVYQDPQFRAAYTDYKRAQWVYEHSHGFIVKAVALVAMIFAKSDYDEIRKQNLERLKELRANRDKLKELCSESLDACEILKNARETQSITDNILAQITEQQESINNQLEIITNEFDGDIKEQKDALQDAIAHYETQCKIREMEKILYEDTMRRRAERRKQVYSNIIEAQDKWIRLSETVNADVPVVSKYVVQAEQIEEAFKNFMAAHENEMTVSEAVRRAPFWKKNALKKDLEEARRASREAFAALHEAGVSEYFESQKMPGDQMNENQYKSVKFSANAHIKGLYKQADFDDKKRGDRKKQLESQTALAEAKKDLIEILSSVPAEQREEAEKALREAAEGADPAVKSKLDGFYRETLDGSAKNIRREKTITYDGQAWDGDVR